MRALTIIDIDEPDGIHTSVHWDEEAGHAWIDIAGDTGESIVRLNLLMSLTSALALVQGLHDDLLITRPRPVRLVPTNQRIPGVQPDPTSTGD